MVASDNAHTKTVDPKARAQMLKSLREQHKATVEVAQTHLREMQSIRKQVCSALRCGPLTVTEVAAMAELSTEQALWHLTAMKKYGLVVEVGQEDGFYRYALAEEAEQ